MLTDELRQKLDFYEKYYFALDEPVPFRQDIKVYPVLVKDYYKFYSLLPCLTMDKNVKKIKVIDEETGMEKEQTVSNPLGMSMSYMSYLCEMMMDNEFGPALTPQVTALLEMVLHIENGLFCPNCHSEKSKISINELVEDLRKYDNEMDKIAYYQQKTICPECGERLREVYSIRDNGKIKKFCIGDYECSSKDFDELIGIITHYNILGYDDDEYIDPDLKADLDLKKKLQNQDFVSPTLEKQIVAVSISTGFLPETIKNEFTMRKLSFMLKLIDSKQMYYTQMGGMFSGMVSFKKDPEHWIYSADKFGRDASKEIMSMDDLRKKLGDAVSG